VLDRVSEHCWVRRSEFCQSNTVVVRGRAGALLVDPGVTGNELAGLVSDLRVAEIDVTTAFCTHPHWDHMLWTSALGDVPRLATRRAVAHSRATLDEARAKAGRLAPGNDVALLGLFEPLPGGATALDWGGPPVRVIEHQGHAPGHAALFVPDDGLLVAGDMLSDVEVPLLDLKSGAADPLSDYEVGLTALEEVLALGCRVLVPGHGAVATGADAVRSRFERDRSYLRALRRPLPVDDPRLDPRASYGPEWLIPEHEAQLEWCRRTASGQAVERGRDATP
jgi:glyoxylase-like metal-dependent hydrolase (beta-lactamase superfamily II)